MKKYWYIYVVIAIVVITVAGFFIFANEAKARNLAMSQAYAEQLYQQDEDLTRAITEQEKENVEKVNQQIKQQEAERKAAEEKAKREAEAKAAAQKAAQSSGSSYSQPSGNGVLTKSNGSIHYNGHRETWYSTNEPGQTVTAYPIPGKNVGSDGIIRDKDGYICVASKNHGAGTVIETSRGTGKVYDKCGTDAIDIYTAW